jgi:hypothetical protein
MTGNLASNLVGRLSRALPPHWRCDPEAPLFDEKVERRVGFQARADLVLENPAGGRVVVELEISRADPVTNQVQFWLARELGELRESDVLVSMFSPHVARGRRNLSALFIRRVRELGVTAFQVSLLPELSPARIKELNHSSVESLKRTRLPARQEIERILSVVEPRGEREHRIHFSGDVTDVMANLWTWNDEMFVRRDQTWRRRKIQFFVFDPVCRVFAPSKFCAFIPAPRALGASAPATMTLDVYESLGEQDPRFDGHRARKHLTRRLAFREVPLEGAVEEWFWEWHRAFGDWVGLRRPLRVLLPPDWYAKA